MKNDYKKFRQKMLLEILVGILAIFLVGTGVATIMPAIIPDYFSKFIICFFTRYLSISDSTATDLYNQLFIYNRGWLVTFGFFVLLLILLIFVILHFIRYFNQISEGINKLLDESEQPIELKPELEPMQIKLNAVKTALKEQKEAAAHSEQQKNDLVVYLAHDLKTPLTSVIGYLNFLQDVPDLTAEKRAKYTAISLKKALRLEELINEFFDITRFNLEDISLEKIKINLSLMLEQMTDEFYPQLSGKNIKATVKTDGDITILGDPNKLARVFNNLLKNAVAYSYENSEIEISAVRSENGVCITFKNSGQKIPEQELSHIFEKFYRLDSARSSYGGGSGLGLAIAKKIVELHGGEITARSTDEFTEFAVHLR